MVPVHVVGVDELLDAVGVAASPKGLIELHDRVGSRTFGKVLFPQDLDFFSRHRSGRRDVPRGVLRAGEAPPRRLRLVRPLVPLGADPRIKRVPLPYWAEISEI